jgi:hypothetical protein
MLLAAFNYTMNAIPPTARIAVGGVIGLGYLAKTYCDKEVEYSVQKVRSAFHEQEIALQKSVHEKEFQVKDKEIQIKETAFQVKEASLQFKEKELALKQTLFEKDVLLKEKELELKKQRWF